MVRGSGRVSSVAMARIPKVLHEHINSSYPEFTCLLASCLPDGYAQVTPRGSAMVYDDDHIGLWERGVESGKGSTATLLEDGSKLTLFFRKQPLRVPLSLPGGIVRFYGTAQVHRSGVVYDELWRRLIDAEKKNDPMQKGFGVLMKVDRVEDLRGNPLEYDLAMQA